MAVEWKKDYAIGVTIIDEQHKMLVKLINDLDQLRKAEPHTANPCSQILDSLDYYIKVHFITEEEIMRIYNYPDFNAHKQIHAVFSDKVSMFRQQYLDRDAQLIFLDRVYIFLEGWLMHHIALEDHKLGPYLNARGLK